MSSRTFGATRLFSVVSVVLSGMAIGAVGASAPAGAEAISAPPVTVTFDSVGAPETWQVPPGVTSIDVIAVGAAGSPFTEHIVYGAVVVSTLSVTPGEPLTVRVGGVSFDPLTGGWNGGGAGSSVGSAGGGATDLRRAPDGLEDRLVVAGGGGGSTADSNGGDGGENGGDAVTPFFPAVGGRGGTQTSGGTGGSLADTDLAGHDGSAGTGGDAQGFGEGSDNGGAGGGGGYYGGGGGTLFGGGGGGSSFGPAGTTYETNTEFEAGSLTISYVPVKVASRTVWLSTANPSKSGGTILYARAMPAVPGGPVPTGTMTFSDGDGRTHEATLNAYGQAVWYDTALRVGTLGEYEVDATYNGDDTYLGSAAPTRVQVVEAAATTVSWLSTAATPNPSVTGSTVLYARVDPVAPGRGPVTTGKIRFTDGTRTLDANVNAYGQAVAYDTALGAGEHTVTATYLGSTDYEASPTISRTQTVNKAATTTTIQTQTKADGTVIVYVTVRAVTPGRGIPTGSVTITSNNGNTSPPLTLNQYGIAAVNTGPSALPLERADYLGSTNYQTSAYVRPAH